MENSQFNALPPSLSILGSGRVPGIVGNFNPQLGIFTDVVLAPRALVPVNKPIDGRDIFPNGIVQLCKAQFDTGADITCITKRVIERYQMAPNGKTDIISVSGQRETNTYIFTIGFLLGAEPQKVGSRTLGRFSFFKPIQGAEIYTDDDDDLEVLIGMDVISAGSFHVESAGYFSFWF